MGDVNADGCTLNTSLTQRGITPLSGGVLRIFPRRNTMSSASFRFGVRVGTALRECIRAVTHKLNSEPVQVAPQQVRTMPEPVMSNEQWEKYRLPALARCKHVDLGGWYDHHMQEIQAKPLKKPRKSRASKALETSPKQDAEPPVKAPAMGPLDQLIA
ncbi:hypothetical protein ALO99_100826 [Pseudomonas coronafaciens pv. porri]|nr:hypothetical protein ALO89_100840 [Pseudomonas coronafaciens pv. porri]RMV94964.1 hypothetical protein ALP00_101122 [Pseudomonas coronafaciens pv. porri]RMW09401.1 hypothetical protein ALO99_100826 [Pseudomonas coronafaciens pv. porri]